MAKDNKIHELDQFAGSNPQIYSIRCQRSEAWLEQHQEDLPSGSGYVRALRAAELDVCPTPAKPWLLRHHVESAVRWLQDECFRHSSPRFAPYGEDLRGMMNGIRLVPSVQRDRLDPVSRERSLWADGEDHRRRFDQWEVCFTDTLDSINSAEAVWR